MAALSIVKYPFSWFLIFAKSGLIICQRSRILLENHFQHYKGCSFSQIWGRFVCMIRYVTWPHKKVVALFLNFDGIPHRCCVASVVSNGANWFNDLVPLIIVLGEIKLINTTHAGYNALIRLLLLSLNIKNKRSEFQS